MAVGLVDPLVVEFLLRPQQQAQQRGAADDLDEPLRVDVGVRLTAQQRPRASRVRTTPNTSVKRPITRALSSASAAMSAISPGSAARTTGLVNTSRAAAIIARTSAAMSPSGCRERRRRRGKRRLVDELGLAGPPAVQRGLGGARPLGDRGHRQIRIADFDKQIRRRAPVWQRRCAGRGAARRRRPCQSEPGLLS